LIVQGNPEGPHHEQQRQGTTGRGHRGTVGHRRQASEAVRSLNDTNISAVNDSVTLSQMTFAEPEVDAAKLPIEGLV
jgi:hypothetical protein